MAEKSIKERRALVQYRAMSFSFLNATSFLSQFNSASVLVKRCIWISSSVEDWEARGTLAFQLLPDTYDKQTEIYIPKKIEKMDYSAKAARNTLSYSNSVERVICT